MERAWGERDCQQCLSMYSITENIYYSQLSSVAILLQLEPNCFTSYNTRKGLCSVSLCAIILRSPPSSHVSTSVSEARSYFASTITWEVGVLVVSRTCIVYNTGTVDWRTICRTQATWGISVGHRMSHEQPQQMRCRVHVSGVAKRPGLVRVGLTSYIH
jgi:hypothetical protein